MEKSGKRIPPTKEERTALIEKEHSLGHFGRDAIFSSLFDNHNIWWRNMRTDIADIIASCDHCSRFVVQKSGFKPSQFITADGPWAHIQMDCLTHLPKSHEGMTTLLVIVDVFTGFTLAYPVLTTSAKCVAEKLWYTCSVFGLPKIAQSDNGPEFANHVVREVNRLMNVDQRFITPWNPRTDGKVERTIGVLSMIIKKLLQGAERYWPFFVPIAQFYINSKISSVTKSTPFALMFGRDSHNLSQLKSENDEQIDIPHWKAYQEKILSVIYPSIHHRVLANKEKMIDQVDGKHQLLPSKAFPIGAEVMRFDNTRSNKREPAYIGPFIVVRKDENGNCFLQDQADDSFTDHGIPPDQLKLRSPPSVGREEDQTYTVEKILNHRGEFPNVEYFVKWKHYSEGESTWEPPSNFLDTACIRKYWTEKEASLTQQPSSDEVNAHVTHVSQPRRSRRKNH
jgi:transposase InsO family protein